MPTTIGLVYSNHKSVISVVIKTAVVSMATTMITSHGFKQHYPLLCVSLPDNWLTGFRGNVSRLEHLTLNLLTFSLHWLSMNLQQVQCTDV